MKSSDFKLVILFFVSISILGCKKNKENSIRTPISSNTYKTLVAKPAQIKNEINLTGRVEAKQKVQIVSEVQGFYRFSSKEFKDGTLFKKGEVLLKIEDKKFRYNLEGKRSQFISTLTQVLADIEIDYPIEFEDWRAYVFSLQSSEVLPILPKCNNQQLKFFLNSKKIYTSYYQIKSLEETLNDYTVYAPFTGSLTNANLDIGNLIRPGVVLGEIINTETYEIRTSISIDYLKDFHLNQQVVLEIPNLNKTIQAEIVRIGTTIDPTTQGVPIYLEVPGEHLKIGMYVEAKVHTNVFNNALIINKDLLTRDNHVYLLKDSLIVPKSISILKNEKEKVVITGLNSGDIIIAEKLNGNMVGKKGISKK